jgi:hypothetical protein
MRTLFVRLDIEPRANDSTLDDVVEGLAQLCWNWVRNSPSIDSSTIPSEWSIGRFETGDGDFFSIVNTLSNTGRFWRLTREEIGREDENLRYVNHIFIARNEENVEFSILQDVLTDNLQLNEPNYSVYPPSLISLIMGEFECKFEGQELDNKWMPTPPKLIPKLLTDIYDKNRKLPIILLSKQWENRESIIKKPVRLSKKLAGMAKVYRLGDTNTRQFRESTGKQWVSNGSIRIYWPGSDEDTVNNDSDFFNLYTSRRFKSEFESNENDLCQHLIDRICAATSSIPASSELVKNVRLSIEKKERDLFISDFEERITNSLEKIDNNEEKIKYLSEELTRQKNNIIQKDISISKKDDRVIIEREKNVAIINRLRARNEELKQLKLIAHAVKEAKRKSPDSDLDEFISHLNKFGEEEDLSEEPEPEPEFATLFEAVKTAKEKFSGRLFFSEDCLKSAGNHIGDVDPSDIFEVFRTLHDDVWNDMKESQNNKSNFIIKDVMREYFQGKYAGSESRETMDRFGKEKNSNGRLFSWKGCLIRMKPHLRLGSKDNPIRIHLLLLPRKNTRYEVIHGGAKSRIINNYPCILIGWCGEHLPIATSY